VRVAVVGAGPAGSFLARRLALDGASTTIFDGSHPREKPCGGGVTPRALALLPHSDTADPLLARMVTSCALESGAEGSVHLDLAEAVAICSRRELDAWLLRRALDAGAVHVEERVVAVSGRTIRTDAGRELRFDVVVGADGAGSLVRRTFLAPIPTERLMIAAGWFAQGTAPMLVRFLPGVRGYLWLFPRRDHVGVGICAPLAAAPTRTLLERLESEVARWFPALGSLGCQRYAHTIPSPSVDPRSILEIAGGAWALVGDAAALADPITGEGIYFALRSAELLADTLREHASPARYPERALEDFGRELLKAAAIQPRFYTPGFVDRVVAYGARSGAIRHVMSDLVSGQQGYRGLRKRLLAAGPRFALDTLRHALVPGARRADRIRV
jgi:geranylgeranyl diphosphate/geranylgeranyl-bacteriochlorophyllide a reductase